MDIAIKLVVGLLAFYALRFAGVPLETFIALIIVLAIGWPVGWIVGSIIGREADVDTARFKAIGWANLVAWIIPIAGVAVAKLTSSVGRESVKSQFFYDGMSVLGYGLVLVNVALYMPLLKAAQEHEVQPEKFVESPFQDRGVPAERSFARCPYAAMEGWSRDDVETYCNREPSEADLRAFEEEQKRFLASQE